MVFDARCNRGGQFVGDEVRSDKQVRTGFGCRVWTAWIERKRFVRFEWSFQASVNLIGETHTGTSRCASRAPLREA